MTEQSETPPIEILTSRPGRKKPPERTTEGNSPTVRERRVAAKRQAAQTVSDAEGVKELGETELDPFDGAPYTPPDGSSPTESPKRPRVSAPDKNSTKTNASNRPPSVDEWQDFIGRLVLRSLFEGYMALVLKDVELTPREEAYIALSKDDMREMAAPFASFANKTPALRKHGRTIIAAADSWEACVSMILWMRRVNKVAGRHRSEIQTLKAAKQHTHKTHAKDQVTDPNVVSMMERQARNNVATGPAEQQQPAGDRPGQPPITPGLPVVNPGSG